MRKSLSLTAVLLPLGKLQYSSLLASAADGHVGHCCRESCASTCLLVNTYMGIRWTPEARSEMVGLGYTHYHQALSHRSNYFLMGISFLTHLKHQIPP